MSKTVSHYRLEEEIGQGGMGRVYKAYDVMLDRTVVLKLLAAELTADEDSRKRFLREARLASALDHPNICTIYEIAEADSQYFIAMQYIPGKTLKKFIGTKPLSLDSVLSIALQVGDALAAAHAKGIIHRDVKSSNILITPRGQAKVLDFGLAKLLNEKGRAAASEPQMDELTRLGAPLGTPSYMSPEQARGERADHRSDIYSFGVVLYEMATGRLPFKGQSSVEVMHAVLHRTYKPARESNDKLPEAVAAVIDHAMERNVSDRYQTMQQMIEDLQHVSVALRFSAQGVPDGITLPFVLPRRQSSRRSFAQFISRMFAGAQTEAPNIQPHAPLQREGAAQDFASSAGTQKTLAVLPFRNLGGDAQSDLFGLSFADSLITELARVRSISVVPLTIIEKYQDQAIDPARIRSELGADSVLIGNFLKAGERLRVTAQLVDGATGAILWSEKIDGDACDVLKIQDRISKQIISGLSVGQVAVDPTDLLKDESEEIRLDAVRTLKFSHDPRALPALVEALRDASLKVKAEAVQAIVGLGEQATGPVIQLLNDSMDEGDNLTGRFAAKALGLIGDRSISSVLIELLRSNDKFVACEAALALGRLREPKAVAPLMAMLEEPDGNARFAAAEALGEICDPVVRDQLQRRLNDDDEGVRAKARWALSRLRMRASGAPGHGQV